MRCGPTGWPCSPTPSGSDERLAELRDAFIDTGIEYLADDGAGITRRIHTDRRDQLAVLRGVAEETTSGVRPLRTMAAEGALAVPCVAVNDARTKLLFDNVYGTGQSVVMAVLDATNMQMGGTRARRRRIRAGRPGHRRRWPAGWGRGSAWPRSTPWPRSPRSTTATTWRLWPRPCATPTSSSRRRGSATRSPPTTSPRCATARWLRSVAPGGPSSTSPTCVLGEEVRPHVHAVTVASDVTVFVVAAGRCANTTAGEGNPIEVMDLSLALQLRALDYLATHDLAPGVHLLPAAIDDEVAASQLRAAGLAIDTPSDAQRRWAASW